MTREDFEKMGFDLSKPTMEDFARNNGISIQFKEMDMEQVEMFIKLNLMYKDDKCAGLISDEEWQSEPLVKMANNWMDKFPGVFDPATFVMGIICFNINRPGLLNLFIIRCLEWYLHHQQTITPDIISMQIFPMGLYKDEVCRNIVNVCLKEHETLFSEIY